MLLIPLSVLLSLSTPAAGVAGFCPPACCSSPQSVQAQVAPTQPPTGVSTPVAPVANATPVAAATAGSACCAPGCCAP
jgi:hypothetical protein